MSAESRRRAPGRPWPKGVSGNPGGRPREWSDFRRLARAVGAPVAFDTLMTAMRSKHPLARVRAAQVMLAYAWGTPMQVQTGYVPGLPARLQGRERPSGAYRLTLHVVGADGKPLPVPSPDDGGEAGEDSYSLPPSSGVPEA